MYRPISSLPICAQAYVLTVEAYNNAFPVNQDLCTVDIIISVNCNPGEPSFQQGFYSNQVCESAALGTRVVCVLAEDPDGDVISYTMLENRNNFQTEYPSDYFFMTADGCVYVKAELAQSTLDTYTFSVQARDNSYPQKDTTTSVQIVIQRDMAAPVFNWQDGNCISVASDVVVNSSTPILSMTASDADIIVSGLQ